MATAPVCTIDATGIHVPSYADCLAYFQDSYRAIYGADVYLENDSQDGQWIATQALALSDANAQTAAAYNAFSPSTAQGAGLSSVVKINGISRLVPSNSTVDLLVVGQVGRVITNGIAQDDAGNSWALPVSVTIPPAGQITITATCTAPGAIAAPAGTVTRIATPTIGWQTVTNLAAAAEGAPVESDAALRARQALSTALPSRTVLDGIEGAVESLAGVTRLRGYENDGYAPDENGIPGHSIALVVEGGDAQAIAQAIYGKKTPGTGTYGTTSETVIDSNGVARQIGFFRPAEVTIAVNMTVRAKAGYSTLISQEIQQAISDFVASIPIGDDVELGALYVPARLSNGPDGKTYDIKSLAIGRAGGLLAAADVAIAFNEVATCPVSQILITPV